MKNKVDIGKDARGVLERNTVLAEKDYVHEKPGKDDKWKPIHKERMCAFQMVERRTAERAAMWAVKKGRKDVLDRVLMVGDEYKEHYGSSVIRMSAAALVLRLQELLKGMDENAE
jgi:hypothetical protein